MIKNLAKPLRINNFSACRLKLLLLFFVIIIVASCTPAQPELPFEEKLVIRGLLEAGQILADIQISKTIPVLEEFTFEKIFVGDAEATITVDGTSYKMELQPRVSTSATVPFRSLYRVSNLRVIAGKTYRLEVKWRGKTARATAIVPLQPEIQSAEVIASIVPIASVSAISRLDTVFESRANINARENEVYRVGTTLNDLQTGRLLSSRGFGEASLITTPQILVATSNTWRLTTATVQIITNRLQSRVLVEAYHGSFWNYYQTRTRSGQVGLFSPGGPNIEWNVTGDGIGEFAGVAVSQRNTLVRIR